MIIRDGDFRLFDWDPETGRTVWYKFDGEKEVFRVDQPVDDIIRVNNEAFNDSNGQRWGDGRRVASVPTTLWHKDLEEAHNQGDDKYVSRWLNDSDHRAFRTFEGQI